MHKWLKASTTGSILMVLGLIGFMAVMLIYPAKGNWAGGMLHEGKTISQETSAALVHDSLGSERFQRPSAESPLPNPYDFSDFEDEIAMPTFRQPADAVLAYYGILRDAANMDGYSGGCGTIGQAGLPYPDAYRLLAPEKQKEMSFRQFTNSFRGIGHMTLLKLYPAYAPPNTPENTKYYFLEIEVITGKKDNDADFAYNKQLSYFAYYYGIVTAVNTTEGWKIGAADYVGEDFLCAPYHGWFYLADAVTEIVYKNNMKVFDNVESIDRQGDRIIVTASGNEKHYRLEFVRLTNGQDLLLHEYVQEDGSWKEIDLLSDDWKNMKFSILTVA